MNCVIYARVSTVEQAEKDLSIPAQLRAMREYAKQRDWVVVDEFVEPGASAKTAERPALKRLLASIASHQPRIDVVVVHKVDRWARRLFDHLMIQAQLTRAGVRLASVTENLEDTASGRLSEHMLASFAEFYSENLANEVKKGMRQKVLRGGWPHLPPRGYITVRDGQVSRVEIHPTEGPIVRKAFERYATGWHSLKTLSASLAKEGVLAKNGRRLAHQHVNRMLTNPFYIGRIRWKDLDVAGTHPALIDPRLFESVQAALKKRAKDPGAKGSLTGFPLRGVAICASCRGHMTTSRHRRWAYYQCSRHIYDPRSCPTTKYCPAAVAHRDIESICRDLRLTSDTREAIQTKANDLIGLRFRESEVRVISLRAQRSNIRGRELTLTERFVAGDVSPDAYKLACDKLRIEAQAIESELATLRSDSQTVKRSVEDMLRMADSVWELHKFLNDSRRTELLRRVFDRVVLDHNGVAGIVLRPPFDTIFRHLLPRDDGATHIDVGEVATRMVHLAGSNSYDSPAVG